jgi:L-aminopeptidase/D-esterase-like protein
VAANRTPRGDPFSSVRVGHAGVAADGTGVSVVLFGRAAPTVVDVRGGASGTYDTASLSLDATFGRRWAVFFAGGSLFGLDAGAGVRDAILSEGGGQAVFGNPNRVVPVSGAILFDLPTKRSPRADYRHLGSAAVRSARPVRDQAGRVGAASGARIGKYLGRGRSQPGALAVVRAREPGLGNVAAMAVLNSVGAVCEPGSGRWLAGPRRADGSIVPPTLLRRSRSAGTTLLAVVTDVAAPRSVLQRAAVFAHDALGRAVVPAHTATDGDVVFVTSVAAEGVRPRPEHRTGELADALGLAVQRACERAIVAAAGAASRTSSRPVAGALSRGGRGSGRSS